MRSLKPNNIIFVMVGDKYSPDDVNRLAESLLMNDSSLNYYCLTDYPNPDRFIKQINVVPYTKLWRGVWSKLTMFDRRFPIHGRNMFFDLDTLIVNNPFIDLNIDWSKLTMVDCHWKSESMIRETNSDTIFNSSILTWDSSNVFLHSLWDHFANHGLSDYYTRKYAGIDRFIYHEVTAEQRKGEYRTFPQEYLRSYKNELFKPDVCVITFEEVDFGSIDIKTVLKDY